MDLTPYPTGQRPKAVLATASQGRELPDDPALPGLMAIKQLGLAGALPALDLPDAPIELINRAYTAGERITLEARSGGRRFAVKAYADDPTGEAALYQSLGAAGLSGKSECRAPPLLLWEKGLRVLVIGWLEGPNAEQLILSGQGARAGELGAMWLRHMAQISVGLGPHYAPEPVVSAKESRLISDAILGETASALAEKLDRTRPTTANPRLVHGTFYSHHVIDLGDGAGVIDWQRYCQGPLELDAGIFLATAWRTRMWPERPELQVAHAEQSFLAGTQGLFDAHALAWHRSAMLLRLARKVARRKNEEDWSARAHALLMEAARFAVAG